MTTSPVAMPMRTCSRSPPTDVALTAAGNGKASTHGAFGIGLTGFGPAEIDQHAVTHVTRNEAVELLDRRGDAGLVGANDLSQILGIKPRRKGGRADKIAEHHA